jgi:hypothetical protein
MAGRKSSMGTSMGQRTSMGTSRRTDLRIDPNADASLVTREPGLSTSASPKPKTPQYGHGIVQKQSMALLRKAFNAYDEEHTGAIPVSAVSQSTQTCGNLRFLNVASFAYQQKHVLINFFVHEETWRRFSGEFSVSKPGQIHFSHNQGYF